MGCGASVKEKEEMPPQPEELPKELELDFPVWNEHCKGKLLGQPSKDGLKQWKARVKAQKTKLFLPGADFTDAKIMDSVRKAYQDVAKSTAKMCRPIAWAMCSVNLKTEMVDANAFIGERDCKLRPGYRYDNSQLKLLIIVPKKKAGGSLPAIVLAAPISLDNSDCELYNWLGKVWASCMEAAVILVGFRGYPVADYPAGMMDMVAAIKWTHAKASDLGIDSTRISLGAQSAGGFVACPTPLELAARGEAELLKVVLLESPSLFPDGMFGPYENMSEFQKYVWSHPFKAMYIGTAGKDWQALEEGKDPSLFVLHAPDEFVKKAPKHVIFCAEFDDLIWAYHQYAARLNACNVLQEFAVVPGASHNNICAAMMAGGIPWYIDAFKQHL